MKSPAPESKVPLPGYSIGKLVFKSSRSLYFIGHPHDRNQKVLVRFLKKNLLSAGDIARFKDEYLLLRELSDIAGIPGPLQIETTAYGPAMILKYFDGELLADILRREGQKNPTSESTPLPEKNNAVNDPVDHFLSIGISLTRLIGDLHSSGIIHQQVQPENIVWHAETGQARLIDFSNAKRYSRPDNKTGIKDISSGNLSYIAPEQTGRINRSVDFRTDFYALGVTFYQMLTGSLPFVTDDAMQMVHAHIAKSPVPPDTIDPEIPSVISAIILKLMAKKPSDRYQSAHGLLADLNKCKAQLKTKIIDFEIGQADIADRLTIPKDIFGRDAEIKKLTETFERASAGNMEVLMLTGGAGMGKSRLAEEIIVSVRRRNGFLISSEFDRLKQDIPYASLMQAFQDLIRQILTMDENSISKWRNLLLNGLKDDCRVMAGVIPELESITGLPPVFSRLSSIEYEKKFHIIFKKFISLFAAAENPMVIFMDNLQWADTPTLLLIEKMLKTSGIPHCLMVGALRESDIARSRSENFFPDALNTLNIKWDVIELKPLAPESVNQMVAATLSLHSDQTIDLSKLIHKKTGGNPFFIFQFIKTLYEKGHIAYDGSWQFDLPAIAQADITENLADFMALHLQRLSENVMEIIQTASCIGVKFSYDLIAQVTKKSYLSVTEVLVEAIQEGLLVSVEGGIKFAHDRVRDAAYSMMDEDLRIQRHQEIGQALLAQKNAKQIAENIFEIVFHLNKSIDRLSDSRARNDLAGYNLTAALKAKTAGAYQSARRYLSRASRLQAENAWQDAYDMALSIHNESCEVAYLTGDHDTVDKFFEIIRIHAKTPLDKIRAYEIKIVMLTVSNQAAAAIALSIEALHSLGTRFPKKTSKLHIVAGLINTKFLLRNKTPEDLLDLPEITDPEKLAVARILMRLTEPSYVESPDVLIIAVLKLLALTVKSGNSKYSAFAYVCYGGILCTVFDSFEKGREYADLALRTINKFDAEPLKAKVNLLIGGGIHHWSHPLKEDLAYMLAAYDNGVEFGDHSFAAYGLSIYMYTLFFTGTPIDNVAENFNKYYSPLKVLHQESTLQEFLLWYQLVENLKTKTANPTKIAGRICDEDELTAQWQAVNDLNRLGIHNVGKMILHYLFDEIEASLHCAEKGEKYIEAIMGQIFISEYYFYYSLAMIAACHSTTPRISERSRNRYMRKIKSNQKKTGKWARHAPENFEHQYLLIEAGLAAVEHSFEKAMILFNSSISKAAQNGFLQDEAIANEVAGKIWHALGNNEIAGIFMTRAYRCYQRWGAGAKLERLEKHYSRLLAGIRASLPDTWQEQTLEQNLPEKNREAVSAFDISAIDVATVIKAAQTVSEEIILERLIHQLIRLNIETAGAEKGVLLLKENERFIVRAVGRLEDNEIDVAQPHGVISDLVPVSLVRFVGRTGKTVLLSDASKEKLFAEDPYIVRQSPKSVICIPVAHQQHLTAVMYLENNLAEGVFTPKRQEILKIIASQAAISIDNALLYEELKDTEQRLNNLLKTANEGFLSLDRDAVITDINPEMCRILGQKRENVIGRGYYEFLDAQGTEMVKGQMELRLQGKKGAYDISFTRPEGTRVDCLVKAAPLFDKSNNIIGSFAMVTDITERKRAESEREKLNRELEDRVRQRTAELEESLETLKKAQDHLIQSEKMAALGGLVAGVTHEINTPIGIGITANSFVEEKLRTLQKQYQSQNLSAEEFENILKVTLEAANTVQNNLKRAVAMVGSFKEIAVDQSSENRRRFNVKEYLDEILMSLAPKFKRTRHEIITVCAENLEINSYPGVFSQIITNLIVNSFTHAFEKTDAGEMEIRITLEDNHLVMDYRDNGCGMTPETAAKIFDPFFTTRRSSGGAGLGMYIVYNIVTQTLGGQIECHSAPDDGIQIAIRIPMKNLGYTDDDELHSDDSKTDSKSSLL